jgi:hypothetical protein
MLTVANPSMELGSFREKALRERIGKAGSDFLKKVLASLYE